MTCLIDCLPTRLLQTCILYPPNHTCQPWLGLSVYLQVYNKLTLLTFLHFLEEMLNGRCQRVDVDVLDHAGTT